MKNIVFLLFPILVHASTIQLGIDRVFQENYASILQKKQIGLITNQTGVDSHLRSNIELFKENTKLVAIFSPEHGLKGGERATHMISNGKEKGIRLYSLHGETKRPTDEMLKGIDVLVYDIQEIGCRSYTYVSTLFYVMEEAVKRKIPVIVLDRPNPMGGVVDGPMLKEKMRSFLGYINIPYCHGMTVGELAQFFNEEYHIGCNLRVIPMTGWKRSMVFKETGLSWIPTSPYIPESDTPFYYASTGILGSLNVVSIGIGYTLPFKVVGAPWIHAEEFANKLNAQKLPGVRFLPFHYKPFYGKFKDQQCEGIQLIITDPKIYKPLAVQYMLIGILKSMYPLEFQKKIDILTSIEKDSFCKASGNTKMLDLIQKEKYIAWKMIEYDEQERIRFLDKRKKYLIYGE